MTPARSSPDSLNYVHANWRVPACFHALTTTRRGGVSGGPYASLNLGAHVGDTTECVDENRRLLIDDCKLTDAPLWLDQVHGIDVADADVCANHPLRVADAAITRDNHRVLAIMTADCLPIALCHPQERVMAAVHGGWRGLERGVLKSTIDAMKCDPTGLHVWLGPAIGPDKFEVGDEVWDKFVASDWQMARCFRATGQQTFVANLYMIAQLQLEKLGVDQISGGGYCTMSDAERFFSYRRDPVTGRMATLVWMTPHHELR